MLLTHRIRRYRKQVQINIIIIIRSRKDKTQQYCQLFLTIYIKVAINIYATKIVLILIFKMA